MFGLGSALVTMVGTNMGAGQLARARRIVWTGAALAAAAHRSIGLTAALASRALAGPLQRRIPTYWPPGATYLHVVGPAYGFFGLGLALYFASQGLGRLGWPLIAGFARLTVAAVGGWIVVHRLGGGLPALFAVIALALVVFGTTVATACGERARDARRVTATDLYIPHTRA